jgi:hypothetical protein
VDGILSSDTSPTGYLPASQFFIKLAFAAPASALPSSPTAFPAHISRLHFLMKFDRAAPASGSPFLPIACNSQVVSNGNICCAATEPHPNVAERSAINSKCFIELPPARGARAEGWLLISWNVGNRAVVRIFGKTRASPPLHEKEVSQAVALCHRPRNGPASRLASCVIFAVRPCAAGVGLPSTTEVRSRREIYASCHKRKRLTVA